MRDGMGVEVVPEPCRRCRWGESLTGMNLVGGEAPPFWTPWMGYRGRWPCWEGEGRLLCHPTPRAQGRSAALPSATPHVPAPQAHSADHPEAPTPARGRDAKRSPHAPGSLPVSSLCLRWGSSWQDGTITVQKGLISTAVYSGAHSAAARQRLRARGHAVAVPQFPHLHIVAFWEQLSLCF